MVTKQQKQQSMKKMEEALKRYPVVAVATLQNLPSRQFNSVKKKIRGQAEVIVGRAKIMSKAIEKARPELKELEKHFAGSTAIILTDLSPFKLYRIISQSKSKAAAKPGAIAPSDIIVPAGETNLPPGPILSELKQAKIDAKIQGPKVVITKDCTVAKKGEPISEPVAKALAKLGIEPMEVGVAITAVWEKGTIYAPEVLAVDETALMAEIALAHASSLALATEAGFFVKETIPLLVGKAVRAAMAISEKAKVGEEKAAPTDTAQAPPAAQ